MEYSEAVYSDIIITWLARRCLGHLNFVHHHPAEARSTHTLILLYCRYAS